MKFRAQRQATPDVVEHTARAILILTVYWLRRIHSRRLSGRRVERPRYTSHIFQTIGREYMALDATSLPSSRRNQGP